MVQCLQHWMSAFNCLLVCMKNLLREAVKKCSGKEQCPTDLDSPPLLLGQLGSMYWGFCFLHVSSFKFGLSDILKHKMRIFGWQTEKNNWKWMMIFINCMFEDWEKPFHPTHHPPPQKKIPKHSLRIFFAGPPWPLVGHIFLKGSLRSILRFKKYWVAPLRMAWGMATFCPCPDQILPSSVPEFPRAERTETAQAPAGTGTHTLPSRTDNTF